VHGLIFFYIQKFAESVARGSTTWARLRSTVTTASKTFLPSKAYPDEDAVSLLSSIAEVTGTPLADLTERFGGFIAPHLVKVARGVIEPSWRTLDLIENTEQVIHAMIRTTTPEAAPPVIQTVRVAPDEIHLVYTSPRKLCRLAVGLMHGLAYHYGEKLEIEEDSCMLRGDPFCSFVIHAHQRETHDTHSPHSETIMLRSSDEPLVGDGGPPAGSTHPTLAGPVDTGSEPPRPDAMPSVIAGHEVIRLLGQGGMGRVFLARDQQLGREVAIKMMLSNRAGDEAARQRFLRESRATAAVDHDNIVTIHQVGEHRPPGAGFSLPFFVMQRLTGQSLATYREAGGTLRVAEVLRIAREIASGLQAAHAAGLIHRDIKPENIWLEGERKRVKIIDFGLARDAADPSLRLTVDGAIVGTPAYMAPERIAEDATVDFRADLFGVGVMLYEMLSGRLPFEGKSMVTILAAISRGVPRPICEVAADLPQDVCDLVMRLLAHDPDNRPADAAAVVEEITAIEKRLATPG